MLLPEDIKPENSIYYNGAIVLDSLKSEKEIALFDLFEKVRKENNISFSIFILCLDWLFLLGVAQLNQKGKVLLCS